MDAALIFFEFFAQWFDLLLNFDLLSVGYELQQNHLLDSANAEPYLGHCGIEIGNVWNCTVTVNIFGIDVCVFWEVTREITSINDGKCPAAAFTKIGAAFSTVGYYVQSDLLDFLSFGSLNKLAPLIYAMAALGGLIGVAIGAPPKNYVWFVLGPSIYMFLIDSREPVNGVEWVVAKRIQDMEEVWRIAETGLVGTNYYLRTIAGQNSAEFHFLDGNDPGVMNPSKTDSPEAPARVSMPFVWFDAVVSHFVQYMIAWTGSGYTRSPAEARAPGVDQANSTIANMDIDLGYDDFDHNRWYLLSNLKWKYVDSVVAARAQSTYLRDVFHTYMTSECGDAFRRGLDQQKYVASQLTKGGDHTPETELADSVFIHGPPAANGIIYNYQYMYNALVDVSIPVPDLLPDLLTPDELNGFIRSFNWGTLPNGQAIGDGKPVSLEEFLSGSAAYETIGSDGTGFTPRMFMNQTELNCVPIFNILMMAFRFEAGHYYHQIFGRTSVRPTNISEPELLYNMFYGWEIRDVNGELLAEGTKGFNRLKQFTIQLILYHLLRNELAVSYEDERLGIRYTAGQKSENIAEGYNRNIATKSKFGEMYTYGALVPYLQGLVLYFLAMAYPLACLTMIVPGMHKTLFTWASFWAWAKLWDLGFALVFSIERVLWAMMGNNSNMTGSIGARLTETIKPGDNTADPRHGLDFTHGTIAIGCPSGTDSHDCSVPQVGLYNSWDLDADYALNSGLGQDDMMLLNESFEANMRLIDNAMTMGPSLDFDVVNAYYIFIISGMYLAVPAITGQLVLGAKAGAASLATNMISGAASEAGAAGKSHAQGEVVQQMKSAQNAAEHAAFGSEMRKGGANSLAAQSIGQSNQSALAGQEQAFHGQAGAMLREQGQQHVLGGQWRGANLAGQVAAVGHFLGGASGGGGGGGTNPETATGNPADTVGDGARSGTAGAPTVGGSARSAALGGHSSIRGAIGASIGSAVNPGNIVRSGGAVGGQLINKDLYNASSAYNGAAALTGNSAFAAGARGTQAREQGGRLGSQAQYQADMGRWKKLNSWANQMSGKAAAYGHFAGGMDPGSKNRDMMGMAANGQLGAAAKDKAGFFGSAGGFGAQANAWNANLQGMGSQIQSGNGGYNSSTGQYDQNFDPTQQQRGIMDQHKQDSGGDLGRGIAGIPGEAIRTASQMDEQIAGFGGQVAESGRQVWGETFGNEDTAD